VKPSILGQELSLGFADYLPMQDLPKSGTLVSRKRANTTGVRQKLISVMNSGSDGYSSFGSPGTALATAISGGDRILAELFVPVVAFTATSRPVNQP
jgi:hypothetical protein